MGLYDGYRLANSQQVKQYEGSVVPELVQVSQEMQKRYDTSLDQQDYVGRFMNSMKALPQDQSALEEVKGQYKTKLDTLSKRPDLENAVRESTMLARELPADYAGFAQRQQDFAQRQEEYNKKVSEGKLSPEEAQSLLRRDIHQDKGIQKDPSNGKYSGRFSGQQYVETFDMQKAVDTIMDKQFPQTQGWSKEQVGDQWIFKNGQKTVKMPAERIQQIVSSGLQNDPQAMSWIAQQQNLGTYNMDYSKVDPSTVKSPLILERLKRGKDLTTAVKEAVSEGIGKNLLQKAHEYAVSKYYRNDTDTDQGVKENPYYKWNEDKKKENMMLQVASTMTLGGADVNSVNDFEDIKKETGDATRSAMASYSEWTKGLKDGKAKIDLGNGKVGYKDESGKIVDVTDDANAFRQQIAYAKEKQQHLSAVDEAAKRAANFKITPELKAEAQKAYDKEMRFNAPAGSVASAGGNKKVRAQKAYQDIIEATPQFRKYQEELKKRMAGTTVGSDLFAFMNEKTVDGISKNVEGLVSSLGLKNGAIPVQDKNGQQLSADQWDELKGNMRAIGITYTGDPSSPMALVVRAFKDVKGKKTSGEDMIVKLPNTNIQAIAEQGMDATQKDYMRRAAGLATSLNNLTRSFNNNGVSIKANTEDQRGGWTVKVNDKEKTAYSFKDVFEFLDVNHK